MRSEIRHRCLVILILAGFIIPGAFGAESDNARYVEATNRVLLLAQQYATVSNLVLEATATVHAPTIVEANPGKPGDKLKPSPKPRSAGLSEFDYKLWAEARKYRILCVGKPQNGKVSFDFETAYNGERFQLLRRLDKIMTVSSEDKGSQPMAIPNPLTFPFEFLSQADDTNTAASVKYSDVLDTANMALLLQRATLEPAENEQVALKIPASVTALGSPFHFLCVLDPNQNWLPVRISRVSPAGSEITSSRIEYRKIPVDSRDTYWPEKIVHQVSGKGMLLAELVIRVGKLEINSTLPAGIFDIDFTRADSVWDDEAKVFIKSKPATRAAKHSGTNGSQSTIAVVLLCVLVSVGMITVAVLRSRRSKH